MTDPSPVPSPVAWALLVARQRSEATPELVERLDKVESHVRAAYAETLQKEARLGKALQRLARCLAYARSIPEAGLPVVPSLDELWHLLEAELAGRPLPAAQPPASGPPELPVLPRVSPVLAPVVSAPPVSAPAVPAPSVPAAAPLASGLPMPPVPRAPSSFTPEVPPLRPVEPRPMPPGPLDQAPPRDASPQSEERAGSPVDRAVRSTLVSRLETFYQQRRWALREVSTTWGELEALDSALARIVEGFRWSGVTPDSSALASEVDEGPGKAFVACLLGALSPGPDHLLEVLERWGDAGASPSRVDAVTLALRLTGPVEKLDSLQALFARTKEPRLQLALLPILADEGRIGEETLVPLLDSALPRLADCAATQLAWLGRDVGNRSLLESRGLESRRAAFLQAAVALGSTRALEVVRDALDRCEGDLAAHAETLAMAGNGSDVTRLQGVVGRYEMDGPVAEMAILHLGMADAATASVRKLGADPWTVAGALGRAVDPGEPIRRRRWHVLEATIRTGHRPLALHYDCAAPAERQRRVAERIKAACATQRQLAPGRWYHFGRVT